jgi:hypothetical protein
MGPLRGLLLAYYEYYHCQMFHFLPIELVPSAKFDPSGCPSGSALGAVNILHCDGRFPHVSPGTEAATGDHFMTLLPEALWLSKRISGLVSGNGDPKKSHEVFARFIGRVSEWFVMAPSADRASTHVGLPSARKKTLTQKEASLVQQRQSQARRLLLHLQKQSELMEEQP